MMVFISCQSLACNWRSITTKVGRYVWKVCGHKCAHVDAHGHTQVDTEQTVFSVWADTTSSRVWTLDINFV